MEPMYLRSFAPSTEVAATGCVGFDVTSGLPANPQCVCNYGDQTVDFYDRKGDGCVFAMGVESVGCTSQCINVTSCMPTPAPIPQPYGRCTMNPHPEDSCGHALSTCFGTCSGYCDCGSVTGVLAAPPGECLGTCRMAIDNLQDLQCGCGVDTSESCNCTAAMQHQGPTPAPVLPCTQSGERCKLPRYWWDGEGPAITEEGVCCNATRCHRAADDDNLDIPLGHTLFHYGRCVATANTPCHSLEVFGECCPGYKGEECDQPDLCHQVACGSNGGVCDPDTGECACPDGFVGPACALRNCNYQGTFKATTNKCICHRGWAGDECDQCALMPPTSQRQYICVPNMLDNSYVLVLALTSDTVRYIRGELAAHPVLGYPAIWPGGTGYDGVRRSCDCRPMGVESRQRQRRSPGTSSSTALVVKDQYPRLTQSEANLYDMIIQECLNASAAMQEDLDAITCLWEVCLEVSQHGSPRAFYIATIVLGVVASALAIAVVWTCFDNRRLRHRIQYLKRADEGFDNQSPPPPAVGSSVLNLAPAHPTLHQRQQHHGFGGGQY